MANAVRCIGFRRVLPGLGRLAVESVQFSDLPLLLGVMLFSATMILLFNIIVDACYARDGRSFLVEVPIDPDQLIGLNPRLNNLTTKTYL